MRRAFIAVVVLGMIVALAISTATATAYPGQAAGQDNSADANALAGNANLTGQNIDQSQSGSGTQVAGQDNSSGQAAEAGAIALQDKPSNTAVGIRVLSPGDDGNVHQSNSADANALAGNLNLTGQNIDQSQGGTAAPVIAPVATPCGCQSGTQVAGQSNSNWQDAGALAVAAQDKPSNTAVGIRVLSPGDDGNVSQSNSADANALAGNANLTGQNIDQSQSGSGTQVAGQDNSSGQAAEAGAIALQDKPSNTAVGIRVLSPGDDGNVHQSNSADANALAGNLNLTGQNIDQSQGGTAAPVIAPVATPCGCQSGTQVAGQSNSNWQDAGALAVAAQDKPSNTAVGIRVLSPGDDGNVSQSNSADANALAGNANLTGQNIDQSQSGSGTQVAGQDNSSGQAAEAGAIALQDKPSNTAVGIRVLSPGDDGNVHQSNSADANALAGNLNLTGQNIDQAAGGDYSRCGCGGSPIQVAGQSNASQQGAFALGLAAQLHPSNTATSTNVGGGYGCGCEPSRKAPSSGSGNVHQSNSVDANALAGNINLTGQNIDQAAGGDYSRCGCGGSPIQVAGQSNASQQGAFALGLAAQLHPSNTATSTDVGDGYGCGCEPSRKAPSSGSGNVHQSNSVDANALAGNINLTGQNIDQAAGGDYSRCGCGGSPIQVAGQSNASQQGAFALGLAAQLHPSNTATSTNVGGGYGCGCEHLAQGPLTGVGQRPPVQQRRCKRARAESERHQAVHRSDRCRRCDPGRRAARGEPPGGGSTRCGTPVRSGQQSDVAQRAMVRSPMSCGRTIATLCRLTRRPSVPIVKAQERMGSGMDPRSKWVLRPAGVCVVGTLMVLCGLAAAGGALAAPGQSILRPDAPPSGAVVSPAPDQPTPTQCGGPMRCELRPPLPVRRWRLPNHPIPSLVPLHSPGGQPPRTPLCGLPRPHTPQRSRTRSCSRGKGACPTVSEPSWPPRSPASATGGPTARSRPSRAHSSRWWPSVPVA